ncbi:hypothetical protein LEP1GSC191_1969 [Leptospira borgpetersenii serovar Mini str. 201000851]|uniref:Uncharacterized protein n=2 Tax=Leptospira borgpetersenii TaxID=174 RepID=A0A0S2IRR2_LEPBO|nr:hypothetical protein LBBP_02086 [Leptospira borgpetersenii serovar Ballum]EKP14210.1 hypothetical protein LEP1GSC128_2879 [Leptospira borgpetersenii str. 200801926]EKR00123.1 hypothetical protein LEP1GSC121_3815 [Leptospira borgpetersenii serovar Castellonis str. 200801910]EMK12653.1 hypothetical protein LEP1GSC066_3662 [Leptospira sp. serovar Kenya str. Sh9]EMN11355.1 hypothetical protein LEP1GSC055_2663 [Leptospira borgpetersenii str. Brem 307]EMN58822.1 hypothetical protein LEP1GSC090_10
MITSASKTQNRNKKGADQCRTPFNSVTVLENFFLIPVISKHVP